MFGKELRLHIDAISDEPPSEQLSYYLPLPRSGVKSFRKYGSRCKKTWRSVLVSRMRSAMHSAREVALRPYKVGELVWLEEKAVLRWMCQKFYHPWSGPWRVIKVESSEAHVMYAILGEFPSEDPLPTRNAKLTKWYWSAFWIQWSRYC